MSLVYTALLAHFTEEIILGISHEGINYFHQKFIICEGSVGVRCLLEGNSPIAQSSYKDLFVTRAEGHTILYSLHLFYSALYLVVFLLIASVPSHAK